MPVGHQRRGWIDDRQRGLERLLHGRDGDALQTLGLDVLTLRAVAAQGHDGVDPELYELLDEPLHAVGVLRGGDGYGEARGPRIEDYLLIEYLEHGSARVGHGKSAVIEVSVAIDHVDVVALTAAEHPHHMRALVGRQHGIAFNIRSVEAYHIK